VTGRATRLLMFNVALTFGAHLVAGVLAQEQPCRGAWSLRIGAGQEEGSGSSYSVYLRNDSTYLRRISLQGLGLQREIGEAIAGGEVWTLVSPHGADPAVSQRLIEPHQGLGFRVVKSAPETAKENVSFALAFVELDGTTGHECGRRQVLQAKAPSAEPLERRGGLNEGGWVAALRRGDTVIWVTIRNGASAPRRICVRSIMAENGSGARRSIWSARGNCVNGPDSEVVWGGELTTRLLDVGRVGASESVVVLAEAEDGRGPDRMISLVAR